MTHLLPTRDGLDASELPAKAWESTVREDVPVDDADEVRYAMSGDARLAFRVRGHGPHEIVMVPSWLSNQDAEPPAGVRSFTDRLSSFATVVSYDQRGTGISDPVSLNDLPTLEGWADDLHAVMTAAGVGPCVLVAGAMSGPIAAAVRRDPSRTDPRADPDQHVRRRRPIRRLRRGQTTRNARADRGPGRAILGDGTVSSDAWIRRLPIEESRQR